MGLFEHWPYANFHEMNLDWIIEIVKNLQKTVDNFSPKMQSYVDTWMTEHPEVTTTVQDGAITEPKINNVLKNKIMNYYITPEMFGAAGDGTTDDTEAIQYMFNNIDQGAIIMCANKYKITGTVNIATPEIVIMGPGIREEVHTFDFEPAAEQSVMFEITAPSVSFIGLTFRGGAGTETTGRGTAIYYNLDNSQYNGNIDAYITHCQIARFKNGIVTAGRNLKVSNSLIALCSICIQLKNTSVISTQLRGYEIVNNRFHQCVECVQNYAAAPVDSMYNILISGNMADIIQRFYTGYNDGLVISGNVITHVTSSTSLISIVKNSSTNFLVNGNRIDGSGSEPQNAMATTLMRIQAPGKISDNVFENCSQHGIILADNANGSMVDSNKFVNCGLSNTSYFAINLSTSGNVYYILNNITGSTNNTSGLGGPATPTSKLANNFV